MHFSKLPFINLRHPADRLCLDEGTADLSTTLPGAKVGVLLGSGGLLDFFLTLGQDELDVARVGHVRVDLVECQLATLPFSLSRLRILRVITYTTVSTVGASPSLGGLVDLDVLDNEVTGVETLGVGVGLSVLEEVGEERGGLDGPASLADAPLVA